MKVIASTVCNGCAKTTLPMTSSAPAISLPERRCRQGGKLSAIQNHIVSLPAATDQTGRWPQQQQLPDRHGAQCALRRQHDAATDFAVPCARRRTTSRCSSREVSCMSCQSRGRDHVEFLLEWFARPQALPVERAGGLPLIPARIFTPIAMLAYPKWRQKIGLGVSFLPAVEWALPSAFAFMATLPRWWS